MQVTAAELHFLRIPLRLVVTHGARAGRTASDSIVLAVRGARGHTGYGEAVVREYVSGVLEGGARIHEEAAKLVRKLLEPFRARESTWNEARSLLLGMPCPPRELPYLCAVETALLDLACAEADADVYAVLGVPPARERLTYGGVIPIVPLEQAEAYVDRYMGFRFTEVKVKVGNDTAYNDAMLGLCRRLLGAGFAIRVDANASWKVASSREHFAVCARHGVRLIEQPFAAAAPGTREVLADARREGFDFIADEGALTESDVSSLAAEGGYGVLNLRLAKNGGLSRVLALAAAAEERGMRYQLGCMVGETAILSALGRVAASLLPAPQYIEGSYDDIILSDNVSEKGIGFGPGGKAEIIRNRRIGFRVRVENLARLSVARVAC